MDSFLIVSEILAWVSEDSVVSFLSNKNSELTESFLGAQVAYDEGE